MQNIEAAQKAQFLEFSQAWDNYMSDYEATAYLSLEKMKVSEHSREWIKESLLSTFNIWCIGKAHARIQSVPRQN